MRVSPKSLLTLFCAALLGAAPALLAESPEIELAIEQSATEVATESDHAPAAEEAGEALTEWYEAPSWSDPTPKGFFGSHCSGPPSPWSCPYTEGGLGCPPGGYCSYTCECDNCTMSDGRVITVQINCTLVDDGGCLACPTSGY